MGHPGEWGTRGGVRRLAPVGRTEPGELARWLIVKFSDNERVVAELRGRFYEGSWMGSMSAWIGGLIEDLAGWTDEPVEVQEWAQELIDALSRDMRAAQLNEEEGGF